MAESTPARVFAQAEKRGDVPAYYEKDGGNWHPTTWSAYADQVRQAARALITLGVEPGDRVCILGFNRSEWVIFDVGAIAVGAAPAGIYITSSPAEVQYILDHSEAPIILLEDEEQWAKVLAELPNLPKLKHVVMMRGVAPIDHEIVMSWEEFLAHGDETPAGKVDELVNALDPDGMATLIYTSGTTGPPKAVMLSNRNLTWTTDEGTRIGRVNADDCSVSYLPLSHIAEQLFTIHGPASIGFTIYYAESIAKLPDNLKEVRPTVVFGVPRIWEKMHAKISDKLDGATGVKAKLAGWAIGVGHEAMAVKHRGGTPSGWLGIKYALANKLIFSKIKAAIGFDRVKLCITAAAPISPTVLEFFAGLDISIQEVYGQSEDTGPATFNRLDNCKIGTVGTKFRGTEIKIADDDEILLKGPHIFLGYFKDEAATAEALIDGWLHTGDCGKLDEDGFLRITGRKKEIIVTSGGKNITPANIEKKINDHPMVSQSVVIGDARKFLSAIVTLEPEKKAEWCKANGVDEATAHENPKLRAEIQAHMEGVVNPSFARVEHIRKFALLPREFSIEDEELTPTMKIKRRIVTRNWAETIDGIYE
jgi:long-chain acyl-CoA synthetase